MAVAERPTRGGAASDRESEPDNGRKPVLEVGERLGNYVVEARLGAGGMAEVYRGRHTSLDKRVAIKVLFPELAANEDLRERFIREGRAASRIDHPHVVNVTDVGKEGDRVFLVMELLEGETLGDLMSREVPMQPSRIIDCLVPVIAAVGAAHKSGVVHRDLKPENVFLARDLNGRPLPKVLDFGVSKLEGTSLARVTQTESVLGTPHYMSPEQARGRRDVDGRTDQYSVGIILYEALVGRLPYDGTSAIELIHEVAAGPVRPPRAFTSSVSDDLDAVLMRALANDPADRYPNMEAFGLALLEFASERTVESWKRALEGTVAASIPPARSADAPRPSTARNRGDVRTAAHRKAPSADRPKPPSGASESAEERESAVRETDARPSGVRTSDAPRQSAPMPSSLADTITKPLAPAAPPAVTTASHPAVAPQPAGSRPIVMIAGLLLVAVLGVGGWLATRPPPPIEHTFQLEPAATVLLDGREVGRGALVTVTVPDDGHTLALEIRADGYEAFEARVAPTALPATVHLEHLPPPPVAAPPEVTAPPVVTAPEVTTPEVVEPETTEPHTTRPRTHVRRPPPPPQGPAPHGPGGDLRMER